jgi:lysozyme family protein
MIIDRMKVLSLWRAAHILPNRLNEMKHVADLIMSFKVQFYDPVEAATKVPWYVVGAIDCREENFSNGSYLGNGDPLYRVSTHVPRGRGPFNSWYAGAIDAFHLDGMDHLPIGGHWDIVTALIKCEGYNGMGYASKGLPSPYVWGGSNIQQAGKYVADGHFSSTTWDTQPGVASMLLALKQFHNVDLNEA